MSKEWFSTRGRLPDAGIDVLAYNNDLGFFVDHIATDDDDFLGLRIDMFIKLFDYWQFLPSPPKLLEAEDE